jgi:hypothetical protein
VEHASVASINDIDIDERRLIAGRRVDGLSWSLASGPVTRASRRSAARGSVMLLQAPLGVSALLVAADPGKGMNRGLGQ